MNINVSMGVYCPKCDITIGTMASVGAQNVCPNCGGKMIAAPSEKKVKVISNFHCECGCRIGHLSVVGDEAKCPDCGKLIE